MSFRKLFILPWVALLAAACGGPDDSTGTSKQPVIGEPYQSECLEQDQGYGEDGDPVEILVFGDAITIVDHHAEFNCCLDAWMEVLIDGTDITVNETEDPDQSGACYCTCAFELSIEVSNLPDGMYTIAVYRQDPGEQTLLHVQTVQVPSDIEPECIDDRDCQAGQVCRQNRCADEPPVDHCLQAGGNCMPDTQAGCPAGTHQLPPGTFVCGGAGGVICCVPGCLSDYDCAGGEACQDGACVGATGCQHHDDCGAGQMCFLGQCLRVDETSCQVGQAGYCWPLGDRWACQCQEVGDFQQCHATDLQMDCLDALEACCSDGCRWACIAPEFCEMIEDGMLNFGQVPVGSAVLRTATLQLRGHSRATITDFRFTPDSDPAFSLVEAPGTPVVLDSGARIDLVVQVLAGTPGDHRARIEIVGNCDAFKLRLVADAAAIGCATHEECGGAAGQSWCVLGDCLPGATPCEAAGGTCTIEIECPGGSYPVSDPDIHCAWCGYCCLGWGCPDLIDCPEGTTCSPDGTCVPETEPACQVPVDCLSLPWSPDCRGGCFGHWECVGSQCVEVYEMETCGDGTCDAAGGESLQSCPDDCVRGCR